MLIERYRTWIFDAPPSDLFLLMIKASCTPEDARFLSRFPFLPHTLEQLSDRMGLSMDELTARMAPLLRRGLLYEAQGKSSVRYCLNDSVFGSYRMPGWAGVDDEWNRAYAPLANRYYIQHMGADFLGHQTKGLRAIPIEKTIRDTRQILPYEDVMAFVELEDYHTVSTCACRHRHNLDPDFASCRHETMNCLHFGPLGRYIVKYGMGKEISREQTREILRNAADAGLVHGISNYRSKMDTICNCCSCCCLFLESIAIAPPNPRGHQRSNYCIEHDPGTCKACGLCEKRCPVGAIKQTGHTDPPGDENRKNREKKEVVYDPDQCIGCGVCAHKCPTQSLKLVRRNGPEEDIPESPSDAGRRMLQERQRDYAKIF
ncbi:MAG TPA: 4Fe-4S binding protein [Deltaproteobacteria bacterium]|nr:4Fe-4S binding protein [Deltaproteobacteria bacterium]HPR56032.1 4Fe-4S binding protein [Deltaproteobacteria bacterium]HXK46971.1 4Fe-4S binding protein [Deltaproteobacteria bacterium]